MGRFHVGEIEIAGQVEPDFIGNKVINGDSDVELTVIESDVCIIRICDRSIVIRQQLSSDIKAKQTLLQASGRLALRYKYEFNGTLLHIHNDIAHAVLQVSIPEQWFSATSPTTGNAVATAVFFQHLRPLSIDGIKGQTYVEELRSVTGCTLEQDDTPGAFSLRSLLLSLPTKATAPDPPPLRKANKEVDEASLHDLPEALICRIISKIQSPHTVRALASACRYFHAVVPDVVPGLNLSLFPHQRVAVHWMLAREADPDSIAHPTIRQFTAIPQESSKSDTESDFESDDDNVCGTSSERHITFLVCTATGGLNITSNPPPELTDFRGGLFCDEPGLGKTITSLALILRSRGCTPAPPKEAQVTRLSTAEGRELMFYSVNANEVDSASKMQRTTAAAAAVHRSKSAPVTRGRRQLLLDDSEKQEWKIHCHGVDKALGFNKYGNLCPFRWDRSNKKKPQQQQEEEEKELKEQVGIRKTTADVFPSETRTPKRQKVSDEFQAHATAGTEIEPMPGAPTPEMADRIGCKPVSPDTGSLTTAAVAASVDDEDKKGKAAEQEVSPFAAVSAGDFSICKVLQFTNPQKSDELDATTTSNTAPISAEKSFFDIDYEGSFNDSADKEDHPQEVGCCWVQCCLCDKWRRLPEGYQVDSDSSNSWACVMHPIRGWRSCKIREDTEEEEGILSQCSGWVSIGQEQGDPQNILFYRQLLDKWRTSLEVRSIYDKSAERKRIRGCLDWLCDQSLQALLQGSYIDVYRREPIHSYGKIFMDIGLEPLLERPGKPTAAATTATSAADANKRKRNKSKPKDPSEATYWRQPLSHRKLQIDAEALQEALYLGPIARQIKVFVSRATLVVVPPELISHWLEQIDGHTSAGTLRVAIYDSKSSGNTTGGGLTPVELAWDYDVVITTFSVMSNEWSSSNPLECCPLMQVHWLRVILDEGHSIGAMDTTNKLQMAIHLRAERRWIMTGTPAPNTGGALKAGYLFPLLQFLHEEPYGVKESGIWEAAIDKTLQALKPEGRWRVLALLHRCMIRASKADLLNFPKLHHKEQVLTMRPNHAESYNLFVDLVRMNLLTSDWQDPNHKESLLNPLNHKRATATLNNIRLSCNAAGNCNLKVRDEDVQEALAMLADWNNEDPPRCLSEGPPFHPEDHPHSFIEQAFRYGGVCQHCNTFHRVLMVTPCAHLLCVDCTSTQPRHCAACTTPYIMQSIDNSERKRDNPNPQWEVPYQLIEVQPAYAQEGATGEGEGAWQVEWMTTETTKCEYLLRRLRQLKVLPPPPESSNNSTELNNRAGSGHLVEDNVDYVDDYRYQEQVMGVEQEDPPNPPKVIIFSQFWGHLKLLDNMFTSRNIPFAFYVRHFTQREKNEEINYFRSSTGYDCNILVMDEAGALGLDLSCVSHIFLMEPMVNASLKDQVESRAWRMGAKKDVTVEILAMKGTPEEEMLTAQKESMAALAGGGGGVSGLEMDRQKLELADRNRLMMLLKPIRTSI